MVYIGIYPVCGALQCSYYIGIDLVQPKEFVIFVSFTFTCADKLLQSALPHMANSWSVVVRYYNGGDDWPYQLNTYGFLGGKTGPVALVELQVPARCVSLTVKTIFCCSVKTIVVK